MFANYSALTSDRRLSIFNQIDPRVKFLLVCVLSLYALILDGLIPLLSLMAFIIAVSFWGKFIKRWIMTSRIYLPVILFIFIGELLHFFLAGKFQIEMLSTATVIALKFLVLVSAFSLFYLTTSIDDFVLALQQSRIPNSFCLTIMLTMRFFPDMVSEAHVVSDAQMSRGLELQKGSIPIRIRNYISLTIPMLVSSLRRSFEVAEALESRGYRLQNRRTSLYELKLRKTDFLAVAFIVSAMIPLIIVNTA